MDPRPCDNPEIHSPAASFFFFSLRACLLSLAALLLRSSTTRFVAADLACSCFVAALFQPTDPDSAPEPEPQPEEPRTTMAILDGEKRSRGLRVPSLASLKSLHKKSSDTSQQKMDALPETPTSPSSSTGIPWDAFSKRLPPNPPSAPPATSPAPMRVPPASASASAFGLDAVPMGDFGSDRYPMPSSHHQQQHHHHHQPAGNLAVPSVQRTPSNGSQRTADSEPLEDFIPEPETEPEIDDTGAIYSPAPPPADAGTGAGAAMHPISNGQEPNGNGNHHNHNHNNNHMIPENGVLEDDDDDDDDVDDDDDWEPPAVDVVAPLGKLHFACYQEHRSMPTSANVWYAVPCMTCQKLDREVRHRCVFCSLRVCQGCYQGLQKCQRRSLGELLGMIQG